MKLRSCGVLVLIAACDQADVGSVDAPAGDGAGGASDGRLADGAGGNPLQSSLTSACATLQGRAIVNHNGNLGIAFTEGESPFTFRGSVQFELPDGYTGAVPDPEGWDGSSPRRVVAMTTAGFETYGNHCWFAGQPSGGGVTIAEYRPSQGIVKATFTGLQLRSCTGAAVCTISGSIETTGEGVFE